MRTLLLALMFACFAAPAWAGEAAPTVTAAGEQRLTAADLEAILNDYLRSQQPRLPQAQYRLRNLRLPAVTLLPAGTLHTQVVPANPQILGSRRFNLVFLVDGRAVTNLTVNAEVEALAPVVTAASELRRGAVIGEQDLLLTVVDISELRDPCLQPEALVGKRLKQNLRAGQALERTVVEFPPLVRRGETVTISVRRDGIALSARGEARQNGQQGEAIRVRNLGTGREIMCRVTAPGQVEVEM